MASLQRAIIVAIALGVAIVFGTVSKLARVILIIAIAMTSCFLMGGFIF